MVSFEGVSLFTLNTATLSAVSNALTELVEIGIGAFEVWASLVVHLAYFTLSH